MAEHHSVAVGAGTLCIDDGTPFEHAWTAAGVTVETTFTGADLLHLAVAGCVLNDTYREARRLELELDGVRVTAEGGFDEEEWSSTGIRYTVAVDSRHSDTEVAGLLEAVDAVAEIPKALRVGTDVRRSGQ